MHILFVCTGNICRSPTAERLTAAFARRAAPANLTASSAGTYGLRDAPMEPTAAEVLTELGGDAKDFRSRRLTPATIGDVDLVLTMTERHREHVLGMAPAYLQRTFTLREAVRLAEASDARSVAELSAARSRFRKSGTDDILDPIGLDVNMFRSVGGEISGLVHQLLEQLVGGRKSRT
ncbi:protein-tyrosine phosphatase [Rhodococcus sp. 27YEA15]|uniref:arsenate reductase/protein-tyrosine-phosphatase family protein n=1 Tax=Rhodococcus sp. 27YEA15 TaxID=3156259 RepID=UPI003C7C3E69